MARCKYFLALVAVLAALCMAVARAQSVAGASHRLAENSALAPALKEIADASLPAGGQPVVKHVDVVLVPVTVTDSENRVITGLEKENFQLFEGGRPQQLHYFWSEDAPLSLGLILDVSGSMSQKIQPARRALQALLQSAHPQDEFFLITFNSRPKLTAGFTSSAAQIQAQLNGLAPHGKTALLDAIHLGIETMGRARNPKKALLIISDGSDNQSRHTPKEISSLVKEADVRLYVIGLFATAPPAEFGPVMLSEITDLSGGRTFPVDSTDDMTEIAGQIGTELRNGYVLGYHPANPAHDGKWRKIKVKLVPPKGMPPLHVYAKTGYYASQ